MAARDTVSGVDSTTAFHDPAALMILEDGLNIKTIWLFSRETKMLFFKIE